ncbi:MAG: hypothetical protein JNJ61_22600 [Anaerolineae bacterium]|nr:hypothetical protein [Anaerolineae bacterium]
MSADWIEVEALAKHLPPSGATLRLIDIGGSASESLRELRGDLDVILSPGKGDGWQVASASVDAVISLDCGLHSDLLGAALAALRDGGRLILIDPHGEPDEALVQTLEQAGYTRILVEPAPRGVLMRGEKPHHEVRTVDRVRQTAARDAGQKAARYVYLLVRQLPNKPVWALTPDEPIEWRAVGVNGDNETVVLAFSSLPKAVEFMQPAVLAGHIHGVNKVAKFRWSVAQAWPFAILLNPSDEILETNTLAWIEVDPKTAEAPDE